MWCSSPAESRGVNPFKANPRVSLDFSASQKKQRKAPDTDHRKPEHGETDERIATELQKPWVPAHVSTLSPLYLFYMRPAQGRTAQLQKAFLWYVLFTKLLCIPLRYRHYSIMGAFLMICSTTTQQAEVVVVAALAVVKDDAGDVGVWLILKARVGIIL